MCGAYLWAARALEFFVEMAHVLVSLFFHQGCFCLAAEVQTEKSSDSQAPKNHDRLSVFVLCYICRLVGALNFLDALRWGHQYFGAPLGVSEWHVPIMLQLCWQEPEHLTCEADAKRLRGL